MYFAEKTLETKNHIFSLCLSGYLICPSGTIMRAGELDWVLCQVAADKWVRGPVDRQSLWHGTV
jgi:hypothetical protein